ncbi:hypothetical protein HDU97_009547 [Phlyctochytrium planicorne]|nr:hypothetical protein HDU97_009547 [Phlyctochytrium planicorne]
METSPLLAGEPQRSPQQPSQGIFPDSFPASYSDSETEDEATGLPSSPPRYVEPNNRKYQDTAFTILYLTALSLLVITGATTLARADHRNEGRSLSGAIYLTLKNSTGILVGVTAASIGAGTLWILFMSAFVKRRQIDHTIDMLQLSCQILWENPSIFGLSIALMFVYMLFAIVWLLAFAHLFLVHGIYPIPMSTRTAVAFFVLMHFWTSAVLQGIEKMTIAGVVGKWYFKRHQDETYEENQTLRNFKAATTTGFGTICFSALILAIVQTLQAFVRYVRKNSRGNTTLLLLIDACMSCTSYALDSITSMTLLYSGLTGHSLLKSGVLCTRLFRRNLVFGLTTSTLTRVVLTLGSVTAASCVGAGTFFYAARGLTSPFAYVVGAIGVVVPFYVLRFISHVLQYTVDATFICYMIDLDTNANNCEGAHRIFEPSLSDWNYANLLIFKARKKDKKKTNFSWWIEVTKYISSPMIAHIASKLLVYLRYDTILPVGASGLLIELAGRNARSILMEARTWIAFLIPLAWIVRMWHGEWPHMSTLLFPFGVKREERTESFGLALVLYLVLLILHDAQQTRNSSHMKMLHPFTHLVLWCLHTFTMTTLMASVLSTAVSSATKTVFFSMPGQHPIDFWLCGMGVLVEVVFSRWTVNWMLFAVGFTWIVAINFAFGLLKMLIRGSFVLSVVPIMTDGQELPLNPSFPENPLLPTIAGTILVFASFTVLWTMEWLREAIFPYHPASPCEKEEKHVSFATVLEKDMIESIIVTQYYSDEQTYLDDIKDDSKLYSEQHFTEGEALEWDEESAMGLLAEEDLHM